MVLSPWFSGSYWLFRLGTEKINLPMLNAFRRCGTHAGAGVVQVALPRPTSISAMLVSSPSIAPDGSGAAQAPISVPVRASLTVLVAFDDGRVRDMTADSRLEVLVSQGADLCAVQRGEPRDVALRGASARSQVAKTRELFDHVSVWWLTPGDAYSPLHTHPQTPPPTAPTSRPSPPPPPQAGCAAWTRGSPSPTCRS
jgi:hypothetical protein